MLKLCWNAIVRNEAARLERCMAALAPHITSYVVVDTGSTDGTPKLIKDFFSERGIPGEIHHAPFENFSQARNVALDAARKSKLDFDYMILVDADMELVVENPNWLDGVGLHCVSFDMQQRAGDLHYMNRRMMNKKAPGQYVGATHEYLDVPASGALTRAYFVDHADGSNRKDKFERDIALLTKSLETEPNNGRTWFYLGQSYRDAGRFTDAANAYKRRVEIGGWDEEVWNAQLNYAHCLKSVGDEGGFLREALVAYNMRPSRAETLYDLAKHFREKGQNHTSNIFSEIGMTIPYTKDALFVSDYCYKTGLREEFSICGFYDESRRKRAYEITDQLALDREGTPWSREGARRNLYYYTKPLVQHLSYFVSHRIPFTPPDGYVAMNPSITTRADGGIACVVRTVNYTITDSGQYAIRGGDGSITDSNPIHTRNFLLKMNDKFEVEHSVEIEQPIDHPSPEYHLVRGFEDMRLMEWQGKLWTSFCVREMNAPGWCEQGLARIGPDARLHALRRMVRTPQEHEKNWAPIVTDERIRFMYRLGHIVDWRGVTLRNERPLRDVGHISGSTQLIPLGLSAWLTVVHEARVRPDNNQRYYQHRFVQMDDEFVILGISKPFVFHDKQIEFAAGLALHPDRQRLMISYGVRDREAHICTVDLEDVVGFIHER